MRRWAAMPEDDSSIEAAPGAGFASTKRFTVRRRLGEGGMGIVYEAYDEERRRPVALKTLHRFDANALARFKREFRAIQGLAHPNLIALHELSVENDQWFFTMELLDGRDFISHVRRDAAPDPYEKTWSEDGARSSRDAASPANAARAPAAAFDEERLRAGLGQLLEALAALHRAGKVHRDVKPSNVLVTREGRVVLLDFGLVADVAGGSLATGSSVVGTPTYMAPEQATSRPVTPAVDLYAVGVMLFEALTGRVPLEGPPLQVLIGKQTAQPPLPHTVAEGVPQDLSALCASLLRLDPATRPSAAEALRSMAAVDVRSLPARHTPTEPRPAFVGRVQELRTLQKAFASTLQGHLQIVLVCGESGVGKSHLVHRFHDDLRRERGDTLVLEGRCYERETVPYKALDGIVDALSHRLSRMSASEVAAFLPARTGPLAQVFPVLLRITSVATERAFPGARLDPHEQRHRAFAALRDMLARIALSRPTVVAIDDMQWADDEGLRALGDVLRQPEAPPLLLLGTVRARGSAGPEVDRLRKAIPGDITLVELPNLGAEEAKQLAENLLRQVGAGDVDPSTIAAEAGGHPLFLEELARLVASGGAAQGDAKLDEAIWARIEHLDPQTRRLVELVAIAGKPVPQDVVAAAAHIEPHDVDHRVAVLRASNLARTDGARRAAAIEPYHDRVREAVLARIDADRRRAGHQELAIAYESSSRGDAETLAMHWREAGNVPNAASHAEMAGDQAVKTFAFDRAAEWYAQACELTATGNGGDATLQAIRIKYAHALANAGRGYEAAVEYQRLAERASSAAQALGLRGRAAAQLLQSGHIDESAAAVRTVLATVGVRLPETPFGVLVSIVYFRAVLWLRGMKFVERDESQISARDVTRLDVCWAVALGMAMVDMVRGFQVSTRYLLLALRAGEPLRIVRGWAMEMVSLAGTGQRARERVARLEALANEVAGRIKGPEAKAWMLIGPGSAAYMIGDFRRALDLCSRAEAAFRGECVGATWEVNTAQHMVIHSLAIMGELKALAELHARWRRAAVERGDLYADTNLRIGDAVYPQLAADDPEAVKADVAIAMARWSTRGFHIEHYNELFAQVSADLYLGNGAHVHDDVLRKWPEMRRSLLLNVELLRVFAYQLRGRAALATAQVSTARREESLRDAARAADGLDRIGSGWGEPMVSLLRAGIAHRHGDRESTVSMLDRAVERFTAHDMFLHAAASRYVRGRLVGGDQGGVDVATARAWAAGQEIKNPPRMFAVFAVGFDDVAGT